MKLHLSWSGALTVCGERLGLSFGDSRLSLSVPNSSSASCIQHRRHIRGGGHIRGEGRTGGADENVLTHAAALHMAHAP